MVKIPEWLMILVVMVVGTIMSFLTNPIMVWGGVIAASVGFMLLGKPYWLLMFLVSWSMTAFVLNSIFDTKLLARADDLMIMLMLAVYLGNVALRRVKPVPYMKVYLITLGVVFFSMVINRSSPKNLALFLLAYCAPYLLFCLVYAVRDNDLGPKLIKLVLGVFVFGVVLNLGWLIGINPIHNIHLGTIDFAKGTFGGCDTNSYFTIFIIFLLLSLIRQADKQKRKIQYGILLAVAFIQFYLSYTNHAYLYFAALFVVYLVITRQRLGGYIALSSLALIVIVLLSTIGQSRMASEMGGYQGFRLTDPDVLKYRLENFQTSHKMNLFHKVVTTGYHEGVLEWLVGHGPGDGVGTVARTSPSSYTFKMLGDYYLTQSGRDNMVGSSITQSPWSGISSLWSEVGMIGTLLFFMLLLLPTKVVVMRLLTRYYDGDGTQKVIAESFVMYAAMFFIINLLNDFWSVDTFTFLLWVLAALALREPREEKVVDLQPESQKVAPAPMKRLPV